MRVKREKERERERDGEREIFEVCFCAKLSFCRRKNARAIKQTKRQTDIVTKLRTRISRFFLSFYFFNIFFVFKCGRDT
jgi:hypothetical protein